MCNQLERRVGAQRLNPWTTTWLEQRCSYLRSICSALTAPQEVGQTITCKIIIFAANLSASFTCFSLRNSLFRCYQTIKWYLFCYSYLFASCSSNKLLSKVTIIVKVISYFKCSVILIFFMQLNNKCLLIIFQSNKIQR